MNKIFFEEKGTELLRRIGMSKTEFARKMGIKKQNVNVLFKSKNLQTIYRAAQVMGVPFEMLVGYTSEPEAVMSGIKEDDLIYQSDKVTLTQERLSDIVCDLIEDGLLSIDGPFYATLHAPAADVILKLDPKSKKWILKESPTASRKKC